MFEHRLKVFLVFLLLVTVTLVLRAAQVQVLQRRAWEKLATDERTRAELIETTRGTIRDYNGVAMATDEPCVDACVDYRALVPEPNKAWVTDVARQRLRDRIGTRFADVPRDKRQVMLDTETKAVREDIRQMIPRLAKVTGRDEQAIEDARLAVVEKVRMRQRFLWYRNYELALQKHEDGVQQAQSRPSSVWQKWLLEETDDDAPDLDSFELRVSDATACHVLIRDVEQDTQTELARHIDRFPGLELRPGTRRIYPLGAVAAHVLGRMSRVMQSDMANDPNPTKELRRYEKTDLKGRGGLEELCEPVLRGVRGRIARLDNREVGIEKPQPGQDVYTTIDVGLQEQVEALFEKVPIKYDDVKGHADYVAMHGAAVVIDVASGELRVLASAPGFDPNRYEEDYASFINPENFNAPLLNRATQALREPGSTVKPMVGMAAVTLGVRRADEGYECTGYMVVNGHYYGVGRCWVNSMFHKLICGPNCRIFPCPRVAHHPVPSQAPHPTGFLTLPDALERSCNPYFESIAHALGPQKLSDWYRRFGLGTKTYVGIAEAAGRLPDDPKHGALAGPNAMISTWSAGIGQGPIAVTPLQMANVSATIARGGVWVRPKLLRQNFSKGGQGAVAPTTQAADRVDLGIPPEALAAVREGMFRVVNGAAGSGDAARRTDVIVCGKTGTAEAALFKVKQRDPKTGKVLTDEKGRPLTMPLEMSSHDNPNPDTPWYRATGRQGDSPHHSWFMGYAPAENPQIAFAVMVEYGGSGGGAAGSVASHIVKLCIEHGYLKLAPKAANPLASAAPPAGLPVTQPVVAAPLAIPAQVELLHDVVATTPASAPATTSANAPAAN